MHHIDPFILDLALVMVVAGIITLFFKKLKQPIVLGYLLAGFLISPHFSLFPTVIQLDSIHSWANIGIIFLMFALGLEFSFTKIADVGTSAVITALTVMTSMIIIGFLVGGILGFSHMDSIFLGGMLSMSSTMIILKSFEENRLKQEKFATLVLGTLVVEDVGGIFMMIILTTISVSQEVSGGKLAGEILILLLLLVTWLVLGIYLIPSFLRKIKGMVNDEILLLVSMGVCFGMVVIAYWIGFSEALGAFVAGSILAGTLSGKRIDKMIKPIKDMFGAVFFISVGMLVQPELLISYTVPILVISVVTIVGQMLFSTLGMILSGQSLKTAVHGGMSMMQIGEFSFIVAALGLSLGVTADYLYPIIVCVSVITIFMTPLSIKSAPRIYRLIDEKIPRKLKIFIGKYTSERRSSSEYDNAWKVYLQRYLRRTLFLSAIMFFIYYMGKKWILTYLQAHFSFTVAGLISALIVFVLMIPVMTITGGRLSNSFKKLWIRNRTNRLPLISLWALQFLIALFFIVLTWRRFLHAPYWVIILGGGLILALVLRSEFFKSQSIKVEARFISNFNEKILHQQKENRGLWMGDDLQIVEFGLKDVGACTNVRMLLRDQILDVLIIKIIRNGEHINMPGPEEEICQGDLVTALSSKGQLSAFLLSLEKADHIKNPSKERISLKAYMDRQLEENIDPENQIMCCVIPVDKTTPFVRRTIKNSGFREHYKGFIVGIERGSYPIVAPPVSTIIEPGDMVWAIGKDTMASHLIRDNIMHE